MHWAFRRLNYDCLTLVRKGDAEAGHPEVLIVAAITGPQFKGLIDGGGRGKGKSVEEKGVRALVCNEMKLVVAILTEDKVPGEVSHQTDMACDTEFQTRANLTKASDVVVRNRINCPELALADNRINLGGRNERIDENAVLVLLVEQLVERRTAANKSETAGHVGRETAKRISSREG